MLPLFAAMVQTVREVLQTLEEVIEDLKDYDLPKDTLLCIEENDINTTAAALSIFEAFTNEAFDKLKITLLDLFVLQAMQGEPTPKDFDTTIAEHFDDDALKGKLQTAFRQMCQGTLTKNKPKRVRPIQIFLTTTGQDFREFVIDTSASLGDIQKDLCVMYGQRFPKKAATLVIGDERFDEFMQKPFDRCRDGAVVTVHFDAESLVESTRVCC